MMPGPYQEGRRMTPEECMNQYRTLRQSAVFRPSVRPDAPWAEAFADCYDALVESQRALGRYRLHLLEMMEKNRSLPGT